MSQPPFSETVWKRPSKPGMASAAIESGTSVDVAIVGGGFMGLSTALDAARRGMSVRVIEARTTGEGASGLNGGQVIPGLKYDPEWLLDHFGPERGEALVEFAGSTADRVFDLIRDEKLDVPHDRSGWIQAAHTETALNAAESRVRQWRARGIDATMLTASDIASLTGARGYIGGWLDRRAGTIDPLSYVLELARVAEAAGVGITQKTMATGLRKSAGHWHVQTSAGAEVRARFVVVATNAYSDTLVPGLAQTLVPLHSFQIATVPLPRSLQDTILPQRQAVSDSRRILVYFRRSPDGRLVLGGRGRMSVPKRADDWRHLERAMTRLYPELEGIAIEKRWFGRVAVTPDHLPHIHQPEPGLLIAAGCQGRGVGLMTALGPCFVDYITSGDTKTLPFPLTPIRPIPFHAFRKIGVAATIAWYRMLDALER